MIGPKDGRTARVSKGKTGGQAAESYATHMGRGQQKEAMASDQFDAVFGTRRGSPEAHANYERAERAGLIHNALAQDEPLPFDLAELLRPMIECFQEADSAAVKIRTRAARGVFVLLHKGLHEAAKLLRDEKMSPEARATLHDFVVEFLLHEEDREIARAHTQDLLRAFTPAFSPNKASDTELDTHEGLTTSAPLIEAIAEVYQGRHEILDTDRQSVLPLAHALWEQPTLLLPHFKPWAKRLTDEISSGNCDGELSKLEQTLGHIGSDENEERANFFSPVRGAIRERRKISPR